MPSTVHTCTVGMTRGISSLPQEACLVLCCRYLYLPVLGGSDSGKEGDFTFRSYPLTDDKDFTNFFHPDKDNILQLVSSGLVVNNTVVQY